MPKMYNNKVVWPLDPHTHAKHVILRSYLGAWFPILNKYNGRIVYIDGFAGPGEYEVLLSGMVDNSVSAL
jgi:three-Cys-motif partner protein